MKLAQLLHVLRAAAEISGEKSFVVVGSQAVLLALDDLLTAGHVGLPTLLERIRLIEQAQDWIDARLAWAQRRAREASGQEPS